MSAKMGRPLKGCSILAHEVKARIDDRTYNELQQYCIENDLKTAEGAEVFHKRIQPLQDLRTSPCLSP